MPQFDTYHSIERFAKHTDDAAAALGFLYLKRRVESIAFWESNKDSEGPTEDSLKARVNLYLGAYSDNNSTRTNKQALTGAELTDKLLNMNKEDRIKWYADICKSAGITIDQEALLKDNHDGTDNA